MHSISGMRVVVHPDAPKLQLSARVCEILNPDFIAEINAWMIDFFGTTNLLDDGQCYQMGDQLIMNPRTFAALRKATP